MKELSEMISIDVYLTRMGRGSTILMQHNGVVLKYCEGIKEVEDILLHPDTIFRLDEGGSNYSLINNDMSEKCRHTCLKADQVNVHMDKSLR